MTALLLIDLQVDYCFGGAMEIPEGETLIPIANELMEQFDCVIATKDWHPANHCSFAATHPWRKVEQTIQWKGHAQKLWPMHCVQNSFGAAFYPTLKQAKINHVVYRGTNADVDGHGAFFDQNEMAQTDLANFLNVLNIDTLYVMGLGTETTVLASVQQAIALGYRVVVLADACKGWQKDKIEEAMEEMKKAGASMVQKDK